MVLQTTMMHKIDASTTLLAMMTVAVLVFANPCAAFNTGGLDRGTPPNTYVAVPGMDVTTSIILNPVAYSPEMPGIGCDGNDIVGGTTAATVQDCMQLCLQTEGCKGYSYHGTSSCGLPNFECYLKDAVVPSAYDTCVSCGFVPEYVPYSFDMEHMMALCAATPTCATVDTTSGYLRAFTPNNTVNSWISNSTCGATPSSILPASCFAPSETFAVCENVPNTAQYDIIDAYALPPFLLEKACDSNKACVGYMATADESKGWLLSWSTVSGGAVGDVGVFLSGL